MIKCTGKTHHCAHTVYDVVGVADIQKGLAGDFARPAVVSKNLHHPHACVNVNFAATGPPFLALVHFGADGCLFNVSVIGSGVANIDGAGHRKHVALAISRHGTVAHEKQLGRLRHDTHDEIRHHDAPDAVVVGAHEVVIYAFFCLTFLRRHGAVQDPRHVIASGSSVVAVGARLFMIRARIETVGIPRLFFPHQHPADVPASVLELLDVTLLLAPMGAFLQKKHIEDFPWARNL